MIGVMSYNASVDRINHLSVAADQARARPRFNPAGMRCDRGKLVDISATGLAVRGSKWGKVGKAYMVELSSSTSRMVAEVEVVRVRSIGLFKHETGCRFVNPEEVGPRLLDLVRERVGSAGGEFMTRSKSPQAPAPVASPHDARCRATETTRASGGPVDPHNRPANVMIPMIPAEALKRKKPPATTDAGSAESKPNPAGASDLGKVPAPDKAGSPSASGPDGDGVTQDERHPAA